jgi:hypothetical protein
MPADRSRWRRPCACVPQQRIRPCSCARYASLNLSALSPYQRQLTIDPVSTLALIREAFRSSLPNSQLYPPELIVGLRA